MEQEKKKMGRPITKKEYRYTTTRIKKPKSRSSRDYDFLQYIRLVFRWATSYSSLSRGEIEALLFLYPKGTFVKSEFILYQKTISMFQSKALEKLIDEGWIKLWRPKKGREAALYSLTNKAKVMCSKMHQFLVGDKEIPVNTRTNPLLKKEKRIDGYYMDMIYKMNKEREQRLKKEEGDE